MPFTAAKRKKLVAGIAAAVGVAAVEVNISRTSSDTSNFFASELTADMTILCPNEKHATSISAFMKSPTFESFFLNLLRNKERFNIPPEGMRVMRVSAQKLTHAPDAMEKIFGKQDQNSREFATSGLILLALLLVLLVLICVGRWNALRGDSNASAKSGAKTAARKPEHDRHDMLKSAQKLYASYELAAPATMYAAAEVSSYQAGAALDEAGEWEKEKEQEMASHTGDDFAMEDV